MSSSRREFVLHGCHALSLLTVAAVIDACSKSPTSPSTGADLPRLTASASGSIVTIDIASTSALSAVGSAALVNTSTGSLLVARTADNAFSALTAVCTHEACTITSYSSSIYTCPCHGSQFSTAGAVVRGPASQALRSFATSFDGTTLTITVA